MSEKICTKCNKIKSLSEFSRRSDRGDLLKSHCKLCIKTYNKNYALSNPDRIKYLRKQTRVRHSEKRKIYDKQHRAENADWYKNYQLVYRYGLTLQEWQDLLNKQEGRCLICNIHYLETPDQQLHVDHCHVTGSVRGLLCRKHNSGLGYFGEDPNLLRAAIKYLESAGVTS